MVGGVRKFFLAPRWVGSYGAALAECDDDRGYSFARVVGGVAGAGVFVKPRTKKKQQKTKTRRRGNSQR